MTPGEDRNFQVHGFRGMGNLAWFATSEEAFAHAVQQTARLRHYHVVLDAAGNHVLPPRS